jgi:sugar phosphate isomerase/epimerase
MKIGFYTSTFSDRPLEEVLDFARDAGFEAIEIDVGSHIRAPGNVASAAEKARERGLFVSSITFFGNQLDSDVGRRRELRAHTAEFARAASDAEIPILVIFPGRDSTITNEDNYKSFADFANDLIRQSDGSRLSLAIENWPGPENTFIGVTPLGWRQLFDLIPEDRFGLEFDPSHLIRLGIDPYEAFEGVKKRVKMLHAKDTSITPDRLQQVGYHGAGWWRYRLPGNGLLDWPRFLRQAKAAGFDGTISIEHEDADYGWPRKDLSERKEGEKKALSFLQATLGTT